MRALAARLRAILHSARRNTVGRAEHDADLAAELLAYVDQLADRYERDGLSPDDARRAALLATGGVTQVKEATRDAWLGSSALATARELRYAFRSLGRSPGFVAIAVLTLAIGIGGATAIFTVINAALLQPLAAVAAPKQLITAERVLPSGELDDISYPDYLDLRDHSATTTLAAYNGTSLTVEDRTGNGREWVSYVSDNFFDVLDVRPTLGRLFQPQDAGRFDAEHVAILSYRLWQRRFGGDSSVIGSTIRISDVPFTVIGIAPARFVGAMKRYHMDLWIPLATMPELVGERRLGETLHGRASGWLRVVGRRKSNATVADATRELDVMSARLAAAFPEDRHLGIRVFDGAGMTADERISAARMPRLLAAAIAILLLIACANVATLCLVRAATKRRELATRLALGGSHASLLRQLLTEGILLASAAAVGGLLIAQALVRSAPLVQSVISMSDLELGLSWPVLAATTIIAGTTAILVSILPMLQVSSTDVAILMKDGSGGAVRARSRGQRALIVLQVSASLVLLASASILYGAFHRVLGTNPGFETRDLASFLIEFRSSKIDSLEEFAVHNRLLERVRAEPTIAKASMTSLVPPATWPSSSRVFHPGEEPSMERLNEPSFDGGTRSYVDGTSPGYFDVMGIPIQSGRDFTTADDATHQRVAIVGRRLANVLWPGQDPIGKMIGWPARRGAPRGLMQIVGIVGDVRHVTLAESPSNVLYVPHAQNRSLTMAIVFRSRSGTAPSYSLINRLVSETDPRASAYGLRDVDSQIAGQLRPQRIVSTWIGVFGAIAVTLAVVGLYGVISQSVVQRTRELAVRSAVGAKPSELATLVIADGARLTGVGIVVGVAGAFLTIRLHGAFSTVQAVDFIAGLAAIGVLIAATIVASYFPARRAARLDIVDVLRSD